LAGAGTPATRYFACWRGGALSPSAHLIFIVAALLASLRRHDSLQLLLRRFQHGPRTVRQLPSSRATLCRASSAWKIPRGQHSIGSAATAGRHWQNRFSILANSGQNKWKSRQSNPCRNLRKGRSNHSEARHANAPALAGWGSCRQPPRFECSGRSRQLFRQVLLGSNPAVPWRSNHFGLLFGRFSSGSATPRWCLVIPVGSLPKPKRSAPSRPGRRFAKKRG